MALGLLYFTALLAITVGLMIWWWENSRPRKTLKSLPGPRPLPLIGNVLLFKTQPHEFFEQILGLCRQYGRSRGMFCLWIGPNASVVLTQAHTIEPILQSSRHLTKSKEYKGFIPWLGTGLLTSSGDKWRHRRRLLTPTFHFKILEDFLSVYNDQCRILTQLLDQQAGDKPFDIFPYCTRCALDIICDSAMGKHSSAQTDRNSAYAEATQEMAGIVQKRALSPWYRADTLFNLSYLGKKQRKCLRIIHKFSRNVIQERSAQLDEHLANNTGKVTMEDLQAGKQPFVVGKQKRLAFLDMLLIGAKGGADLSFQGIQNEVDTFMTAGHDTTAAATAWTLHLLGHHPEIQKRLQDELDTVFGSSDRDVTVEDLKALTYLDRVMKESMRVCAPVPLVARALEEDIVIDGQLIPRGTSVLIHIAALHKDPDYFPDPERFDPDRWLPENSAGRNPFSFVPFSAGFRNCIGQKFATNEEKCILSHVLRKFTVTSHQTRGQTRPCGSVVMRPENGILVTLTPR